MEKYTCIKPPPGGFPRLMTSESAGIEPPFATQYFRRVKVPKEPKRHRIFCEWKNGAFITTLDADFQRVFPKLVEQYGPPDILEFRADNEGWIKVSPSDMILF